MPQPMTEQEARDLKTAINQSGGGGRAFGLCIGAKPAETVFLALKGKRAAELERTARQRAGKTVTARGEMQLDGDVLRLLCEETPPGGLAAKVQSFLQRVVGIAKKVQICSGEGDVLEASDAEAEGAPRTEPRTPPATPPETPPRDPVQEAARAERIRRAEAQAQARADWPEAIGRLTRLVQEVFAARAANPATVREALALAQKAAADGDHVKALRLAERTEARLEEMKAARGQEETESRFRKLHARLDAQVKAVTSAPAVDREQAGLHAMMQEIVALALASADAGDPARGVRQLTTLVPLLRRSAPINASPRNEPLRVDREDEESVAKALADYARLRPRVLAVEGTPRGSREVETLLRRLSALKGRFDKAVAARDLSAAPADVLEQIEGVVAALETARPAAEEAERRRAALIARIDAEAALLRDARGIYDIAGLLTRDVADFRSADQALLSSLAGHDLEQAERDFARLLTDARRLVARRPEFEALRVDEQAVFERLRRINDESRALGYLPASRPEAAKWLKAEREALARFDKAMAAHDWKAAIREGDAVLEALAGLRAAQPAALADDDRRRAAIRRSKAASTLIGRIPKGAEVHPDTVAWKEKARACLRGYHAAMENGDVVAGEKLVARLEGLAAETDRFVDLDAATQATRSASARAYRPVMAGVQAALDLRVGTPRGLAAQKEVRARYAAFQQANVAGRDDWPQRLEELKAATRTLLAMGPAEQTAAGRTFDALDKARRKLGPVCEQARSLALSLRPALDRELADLDACLASAEAIAADMRFMEAVEVWMQAGRIAKAITARRKAAQKRHRQVRAASDARMTPALRQRVLAVPALTPGILPELDALRDRLADRLDEINAAEAGKRWQERLELTGAVEATLAEIEALKPRHDALKADFEWLDQRLAANRAAIGDAFAMLPCTPRLAEALHAFRHAYASFRDLYGAQRYAEARPAFDAAMGALAALAPLQAEHEANKAGYEGVRARLDTTAAERVEAAGMRPLTPTFERLLREMATARDEVDVRLAAADVPGADAAVDRLEAALAAIQAAAWAPERIAAGTVDPRTGATLAADATGPRYEVLLAQAEADREAATRAIADAAPDALLAMPTDAKLDLLAKLRAGRGRLEPDEQALQRKLYDALQPSPEFLALEARRQQELAARIREDDELMGARDAWAGLSMEDRMALLQRTVTMECEIYGMPVARVEFFEQAMPGPSGYFSREAQAMFINTHPSVEMDDFAMMLDTVVHENVHNYQAELVRRLEDGLLEPGDPEYDQARIFQANWARGGYVDAEQADHAAYRTQPLEAEAWSAGTTVPLLVQPPPPQLQPQQPQQPPVDADADPTAAPEALARAEIPQATGAPT